MSKTYTNPETIGLHAGWRKDDSTNSVAVPIHQTSSFQFDVKQHPLMLFKILQEKETTLLLHLIYMEELIINLKTLCRIWELKLDS